VSEIPADVRTALDGLRALGGDDLLKQMITVFVDYSRDRVQALQAASASGDLVAAGGAAHALKGSARQLGCMAFGDACAAAEQAAKDGDAAATATHTAAVYAEYTTAVGWLQSFMA
jgi:HPt (histidine-containing phosphotransfer) domain-containing protein